MAFTTIYVTPGLSDPARRRAIRAGPRAVASRRGQVQLLRSAGFERIEEVDLTADFARTTRAFLEEWTVHADELASVLPAGLFEERQRDRRRQLAAIEEGLLQRSLFVASKPESRRRD